MRKNILLTVAGLVLIFVQGVKGQITFTSPVGGENWQGCTHQTLSWKTTSTTSYVNVYYSVDGGNHWSSVVNRLSSGSTVNNAYSWKVPQFTSSNCKIKVVDYFSPYAFTVSNTFSIFSTTNASLILTSPEGGEKWGTKSKKLIKWNTTGTIPKVKLDYTFDNGNNWFVIDTAANNTGSYLWIVPDNNNTNTYAVRIMDNNTGCMVDQSDSTFTVFAEPNINITCFNSNETLIPNSLKTITWVTPQYSNSVPYVSLDFSVDSGKTWKVISTTEASGAYGSYSWLVPDIPSDKCLIRIKNYSTPALFDICIATFSIAKPFLKLTGPVGGAIFNGCMAQTISWTSNMCSPFVNIHYSTNNGSTWNAIATSTYNKEGSNSYTWYPPNEAFNNCVLKITDAYRKNVSYTSVQSFKIAKNGTNFLSLTNLNGRDTIKTGSKQVITWAGSGTSAKVSIASSNDGGNNWTTVASGVNNTGVYTWMVPNIPGTKYLVRVSDDSNSCLKDVSDTVFTVVAAPYVYITSPNGGEYIYAQSSQSITWEIGNAYKAVDLSYSVDSGKSWVFIAGYVGGNYYNWYVPKTISGKCLIQAKLSMAQLSDVSEGLFNIVNPIITLLTPSGGVSLTSCNNSNITWKNDGSLGTVNIYFSGNNGTTWSTVAASITSNVGINSYAWKTPSMNVDKGLVKVENTTNTLVNDISHNSFSIVKSDTSFIKIMSPNGGEFWVTGLQKNIMWINSTNVKTVNIEYSADNGSSWYSIAYNVANTGSFTWSVSGNGNKYLIRVTDYTNACTYGQSDNMFAVPFFSLNNPSGGESIFNSGFYNIYWSKSTWDTTHVKLEYSIDSARTWLSISNDYPNLGNYQWSLPKATSDKCFIKISKKDNPSILSINKSLFKIIKPGLVLTYPNGNEILSSCTNVSITWQGRTTKDGYLFTLSADSGKTWKVIYSIIGASGSASVSIPALSSTKCLLKISDLDNDSIYVVSNKTFTINNATGNSIKLTSPVGGESLIPGSKNKITWTNTGTVGNVRISYASDGKVFGHSFTLYPGLLNTGSLDYTVPGPATNNFRIWISDYSKGCLMDQSQPVFISDVPFITDIYMQGFSSNGNSIQGSVNWSSGKLKSPNVSIMVSPDSGLTWKTIVSSTPNTGYFIWKENFVESAKCLIKVSDASDPSIFGLSSVLNIKKPVKFSSFPQGQVINSCSILKVNVATTIGGVMVYYYVSLDSCKTWENLGNLDLYSSTGFSYRIPALYAKSCFFKIENAYAPQVLDISPAFGIKDTTGMSLTMVTPNGGEKLGTSETKIVQWNSVGAVGPVSVSYRNGKGTYWYPIGNAPAGSNTFKWLVPNTIDSNYVVKITNNSGCISAKSNARFSVLAASNIGITTPAMGDKWYSAGAQTIKWNSYNLTSAFIALYYSLDSAKTWTLISSKEPNSGTYTWNVPDLASANCFIKINEFGNPAMFSISNFPLVLLQKKIELKAPYGNATVTECGTQAITWSSDGIGQVNLYYSPDNGATWKTIATALPSYANYSNTYNWTIPGIKADKASIKVADASGPLSDVNDTAFSVNHSAGSVKLISPIGGEYLRAGNAKIISWTSSGISTSVVLRYSADSGTTWNSIAPYATNNGFYNWTLPTTPSSNYLVSVSDYSKACIYDQSGSVFSVNTIPTISVTSPASGDSLYQFTTYYLTSNKSSDIPYVIYEYSKDSLRSWEGIPASWTIPNVLSKNCFIRASYGSTYGISPKFSFAKTFVSMTYPKGGESLNGCFYDNVKWYASKGVSNYVNILFSSDNGVNWKYLASNIYSPAGDNSFNLTWPGVISNKCLIKVVDADNPLVFCMTPSVFTINNGLKSLEIVSPNGGENWGTGMTKTITWETYGSVPKVDLKYSLDKGISWTSIANAYSNTNSYSWILPSTVSTDVFVKINDHTNQCISDPSNFPFTIIPSLTVTSPNGGEKLNGCQPATITWSGLGLSNLVNIYFSTDNKQTWSLIGSANNSAGNNNSFTWNVAGVNSSKCFIKVADYYSSVAFGVSANAFSIQSVITNSLLVTSPNGDENWGTGSYRTITWKSSGNIPTVRIEFSTDGGNSWSTLQSSAPNTGLYKWRLVGGPASLNWLVRITDNNNSCTADQSDKVFKVFPANYIEIFSFKTPEIIYSSTYKQVYWNSPGFSYSMFFFEYSVDSMKTWKAIESSNVPNVLQWSVPLENSSKCFLRISNSSGTYFADTSKVPFTIMQTSIALTSLNGGENLATCSVQKISWTSVGPPGSVKIYYSLNNGVTWTLIADNVSNYNGTNSYNWTLPQTASAQCQIWVQDVSKPALQSMSKGTFTIANSAATIALTSPTGGEVINTGTQKNITWTSTGIINSVRLSYSVNGGATWNTIASDINNSGSYIWNVPNISSASNCLIKVSDNGGCSYDQSKSAFTLKAVPSIQLISPKGYETYGTGRYLYIYWSAFNIDSTGVNIDFSTNLGNTWNRIATNVSSQSSYSWILPSSASNQCLIKVSSSKDPLVFDISKNPFSIVAPSINLFYPKGGENLTSCGVANLSWSAVGFNVLTISYSIDNGATWQYISTIDQKQGGGMMSYPWTVPAIASAQCLVRISDYNTSFQVISSSNFSISNKNADALKVSFPNGGEVLDANTIQVIKWTSDTSVKAVNINYSSDNGLSWVNVTRGLPNKGSFSWLVPAMSSANSLIAIFDTSGNCKTGQSGAIFTIKGKPSLLLTSPSGGEKLFSGNFYSIKYISANLGAFIKLEFSGDSGKTWNIISGKTTNTGNYQWVVPIVVSPYCNVRVSDYVDPSVKAQSNAFFSIQVPTIKITRPSGGEAWYGTSTKAVLWSATNINSTFVNIEFSDDSAKTWKIVATKVANNGSYNWILPNIGSSNCYLKISDYNDASIYDRNINVFSIIKPAFTVLFPNKGEVLKACTRNVISWTGTSRNASIQYSTDGGLTWQNIVTGLVDNYTYSWLLPDVSSSKCLIKLIDPNEPTLFDISNVSFTINNIRPSIKLTYPIGGETINTGETKKITWTSDTSVKYVNVEIYVPNGYWTYVNSYQSTIFNTGSVDWTVYQQAGTNYTVRVSDFGSCATDLSAAPFTIKNVPFINVISPKDFSQLTAGSVQTIEWLSGNVSNLGKTIAYSTDLGTTWNTIVSNYNNSTTSYDWTIPYTFSVNCLIKISDASNASISGISKSKFSILKPIVKLNSMTDGGTLNSCMVAQISYTSKSPVNIYFSSDNGLSFKRIANGISSTVYNWTVPQMSSTKCLFMVANSVDTTISDRSTTPFMINNVSTTLAITNIQSLEVIPTGSKKIINWKSTGPVYGVSLEYTIDGGTTWLQITGNINYLGTYEWNVPNYASKNCMVRVKDPYSCAVAISPVFTIDPVPYILLDDLGNASLAAGYSKYLYWASGNVLANPTFNLDYSLDSGKTWVRIATVYNQNSYNWSVPNVSSSLAFVRVSLASNPTIFAKNSKVLTIIKPSYKIITPNGHETLTACVNNMITWKSSVATSVNFYYSTDNGISWTSINAFPVRDDGYYQWMPNELSSTKCLFKIADANNLNNNGKSDTTFTILNVNTSASLTLLSPVDGEVINTYAPKNIKWTSTGKIDYVDVYYSKYGGLYWQAITTVPNTGIFNWSFSEPTLQGEIKIKDHSSCVRDQNNSGFSVKETPFIRVNSPAGGENLTRSTNVTISWFASYLNSSFLKLDYSLDSGKTWINIAASVDATLYSYQWLVPNVSTNNALIKISDAGTPSIYDISKAVFKISPLSVVWPGDADNNGIANVYDLLPIGLNYGLSGIARDSVSIKWMAQSASNWNKVQYNGSDIKFADCNGDRYINSYDTLAISKNYGLTHNKTENVFSYNSVYPDLYFVLPEAIIPGRAFRIEVWAGTSTTKVNNFYGAAFSMSFDGNAIVDKSAKIVFASNLLASTSLSVISIQKAFETSGKLDGAIVGTDRVSVSGYGKLADIYMRLKPDFTGNLQFGFSDYKAVSADGTPLKLNPVMTNAPVIITSSKTIESAFQIDIYPNPNEGIFAIQMGECKEGRSVQILNLLGEEVQVKYSTGKEKTLEIKMDNLPKGIYIVKIKSTNGIETRKVVVQ
jgi:hypothetical protein